MEDVMEDVMEAQAAMELWPTGFMRWRLSESVCATDANQAVAVLWVSDDLVSLDHPPRFHDDDETRRSRADEQEEEKK